MRKNPETSRAPADEAAEWFITLQSESAGREQREAFADWLQRSPVHVEEFLRITALYGDLKGSAAIKEIDIEALRAEVREQDSRVIPLTYSADHQQPGQSSSTSNSRRRRSALFAVAASALIAISVLWMSDSLAPLFGAERYATAVGEQRSLTLKDGSHVKLNVHSQLRARVDDHVRDLRLNEGEALFEVAKDPSRPFRVHTPHAVVEATGTQFNVQVRDGRTTVSLLEGGVRVSKPDASPESGAGPITLSPGEQIVIENRRTNPAAVHTVDPASVTAWTERRLVFEDATLEEVVAEFNRYSRQRIVIENAELKNVRITAVFRSDDMETFTRALHAVSGLDVERSNGAWSIKEPIQQSIAKE